MGVGYGDCYTYIYTYTCIHTHIYVHIYIEINLSISHVINKAIVIKKQHFGPGIGMSPLRPTCKQGSST